MAERRAFQMSAMAGLTSLLLIFVLLLVYPVQVPTAQMAYLPPALALQFALTPMDVLEIFRLAGTPERAEVVHYMRAGNRVDYVFMAAYGLFLALFFAGQVFKTGMRAFWTVLPMVVVAIVFDVLENGVLDHIVDAPDGPAISSQLYILHLYSWAKWSVLAVISAVAAMSFFYRRSMVLGTLCLLPVAIILPAYQVPGRLAVFLVIGVGVSWAVILAHAIKRGLLKPAL